MPEHDKPQQAAPQPSELEKAQQLIDQHKDARLQAFQTELDALCQRYGVELATTPVHITMRLTG